MNAGKTADKKAAEAAFKGTQYGVSTFAEKKKEKKEKKKKEAA